MHKIEEILENYCERIEKELKDLYTKISKSDTLSAQDLDTMDKLLHALKSNKTVWAMVEYDERDDDSSKNSNNGYSGNKYYNESRYRYDDGYSGRRGIPNSGGGRGYSRDGERDEIVRKLEDMMRRVRNEDEAMAIRDAIDTVSRMS